MNHDQKEEVEFSFASVIDFLLHHKWKLTIVTLSAGVLAFIFSMPYFIHPKYKSSLVFFPSQVNSISKVIMSSNPADKADLLQFGQEEQAEQLLQILQSDVITKRICDKYHLMKHYRIDPNSPFPNTVLGDVFRSNVKYSRTEFMSVDVSVLDEDKDTAALIANDIGNLLDSAKIKMQQERAREALAIVKFKYEDKQRFINKMVDSLQQLGKKGILNYEKQADQLSAAYAKAIATGGKLDKLKQEMDTLAKYGPIHSALSESITNETEDLTELRIKYEQAKVDADQALSTKFIINYATPAERKAYPVRSIIVLISMFSAFAFTALILALTDNYRRYKKEHQETETV